MVRCGWVGPDISIRRISLLKTRPEISRPMALLGIVDNRGKVKAVGIVAESGEPLLLGIRPVMAWNYADFHSCRGMSAQDQLGCETRAQVVFWPGRTFRRRPPGQKALARVTLSMSLVS